MMPRNARWTCREVLISLANWAKDAGWSTRVIDRDESQCFALALLMQKEFYKCRADIMDSDHITIYTYPAMDDVVNINRLDGEWALPSGELDRAGFVKLLDAAGSAA